MSLLTQWLLCPLGHQDDPLKVVTGGRLSFECRRCGAEMYHPLKGQKFKARKVKASAKKGRLLRMAERHIREARG